jgi:predicted ribosomally synthesized peptide with SipW-like signal peptide
MRRCAARWTLLAELLLIVLAAAGLAGITGTYSVFSDRETANVSVAAGTVHAPTDPTCAILGWFQAELRWSPSASAVDGYRVYHKGPWPPGGDFRLLAQIPDPAATSYGSLVPSLLRHSYFVTSYLQGWESGPSNTIGVRCRPRLFDFPGPCDLEGENHHSQRAIELSWDAIADAVYYGVLRGTATGGPYELLATTGVPAYTDANVADGVTYFYVVVALDAAGNESDPSAEIGVADVVPAPTATPETPPTPPPTALSVPTSSATVEPTGTAEPAPTPTATAEPTSTATPEG